MRWINFLVMVLSSLFNRCLNKHTAMRHLCIVFIVIAPTASNGVSSTYSRTAGNQINFSNIQISATNLSRSKAGFTCFSWRRYWTSLPLKDQNQILLLIHQDNQLMTYHSNISHPYSVRDLPDVRCKTTLRICGSFV